MILYVRGLTVRAVSFSRTRGGDPYSTSLPLTPFKVFPAHAGGDPGRVFGIGSMGTVFPAHAGVILQI